MADLSITSMKSRGQWDISYNWKKSSISCENFLQKWRQFVFLFPFPFFLFPSQTISSKAIRCICLCVWWREWRKPRWHPRVGCESPNRMRRAFPWRRNQMWDARAWAGWGRHAHWGEEVQVGESERVTNIEKDKIIMNPVMLVWNKYVIYVYMSYIHTYAYSPSSVHTKQIYLTSNTPNT